MITPATTRPKIMNRLDGAPGDLEPLPNAPPWTSYWTVHRRLHKLYGHPRLFTCVCCGTRRAEGWAYTKTDPNPLTTIRAGRPVEYSVDLSRYTSLCWVCHALFDHGLILKGDWMWRLPRLWEVMVAPMPRSRGQAVFDSAN
jgi:hypothetical protein